MFIYALRFIQEFMCVLFHVSDIFISILWNSFLELYNHSSWAAITVELAILEETCCSVIHVPCVLAFGLSHLESLVLGLKACATLGLSEALFPVLGTSCCWKSSLEPVLESWADSVSAQIPAHCI